MQSQQREAALSISYAFGLTWEHSEKRRILTEQVVKKAKGSEEGRERRIAVRTFSNVKSSRDKQGFTLHKEKHHVRVTTSRPEFQPQNRRRVDAFWNWNCSRAILTLRHIETFQQMRLEAAALSLWHNLPCVAPQLPNYEAISVIKSKSNWSSLLNLWLLDSFFSSRTLICFSKKKNNDGRL